MRRVKDIEKQLERQLSGNGREGGTQKKYLDFFFTFLFFISLLVLNSVGTAIILRSVCKLSNIAVVDRSGEGMAGPNGPGRWNTNASARAAK